MGNETIIKTEKGFRIGFAPFSGFADRQNEIKRENAIAKRILRLIYDCETIDVIGNNLFRLEKRLNKLRADNPLLYNRAIGWYDSNELRAEIEQFQ